MEIELNGQAQFIEAQSSLESSYERIKSQINPKTGVVPWIKSLPTPYAKGLFHIYLSKHPIRSKINSLPALRSVFRTSSSAMGRTSQEAMMLAACEALERWSCVNQGTEYAESHTYNEISDKAITPNVLHCISEQQYDNRASTNPKRANAGAYIPERLDPERKVLWSPAYDPVNKKWQYVLKSSSYFGHHDEGHVFSATDSRGVAAGPNLEFCTWRALLELIETDTGAIWNANRLVRPEVNIGSFDDPYLNQLVAVHHDLDREIWVLDISLDIRGIRVFICISRDKDTGNIIKGFGTHPIAHKALEKAIMECCQMLPNVMTPEVFNVDTNTIGLADEASSKPAPAKATPSHFLPDHNRPKLTQEDYEHVEVVTSIDELIKELTEKKIRILLQDVTRPELGISVMRVFGVHMRSWFDRRSPGRLYTVPVSLGLRDEPITEDEVNPQTIE